MSNLNDKQWFCPQCNEPLNQEEVDDARELVKKRGQCELRCDECGEELVADINAFGEGKFQILESWHFL